MLWLHFNIWLSSFIHQSNACNGDELQLVSSFIYFLLGKELIKNRLLLRSISWWNDFISRFLLSNKRNCERERKRKYNINVITDGLAITLCFFYLASPSVAQFRYHHIISHCLLTRGRTWWGTGKKWIWESSARVFIQSCIHAALEKFFW